MWNRHSFATATAIALAILCAPAFAHAQCTNLSGSPAPTPETYAANLVLLKYLNTGPGSGDDRPLLKKSVFSAPSLTFDPQNVHSVHITYSLNTVGGPVMWTTSIPPSVTLWTQSGTAWNFSDPATTYGVRKMKIRDYGGGLFIITKMVGRNTNITNAPVVPGADNVYVMVEIESGGVGICYGGVTIACAGSGNTQKCKD
jgi:hypothetical protein